MSQRRDNTSSPAEKIQATQQLEHLRSTLNNNYAELLQVGERFLFFSFNYLLLFVHIELFLKNYK